MPDAENSPMNKCGLIVIPHLLWNIMEQEKGVLWVFQGSPRVGKVKRVEFIGISNLYIADTWLVDGLVTFAIHGLATLPYHFPAALGVAKPRRQWSAIFRIHKNSLGTLL